MNFIHSIRPLLAAFLTVGGIVGLIGTSNIDVLISWLGTTIAWLSQNVTTQNILMVLLIILGILAYVRYRRYRDVPLTILSTDIQVEIDDINDNKITVTRRQIIRPRHPNITAIYTKLTPSYGGEIPKHGVSGGLENDPCNLENNIEKIGSPKSAWDCMHMVRPSLPFPWYTYFIADRMIARPPWDSRSKIIRKCAVQRRMRVVHLDPEDSESDEQYYQITADRYLQNALSLTLVLPRRFNDEDYVRDRNIASAKWIARSAVEEIPITWKKNDGDRIVGTAHLEKLQNATFGIYWNLQAPATGETVMPRGPALAAESPPPVG